MNNIKNYFSFAVRSLAVVTFLSLSMVNAQVFISEYSEGSSTNKYLEIYNGTGSDLDMAGYGIGVCNNDHSAGDNPDPLYENCLLYTSPSPRDGLLSRMPSSA